MEGTIQTGVDEFLNFLRKVDKISLAEAAKKLNVSPALLQSWVDFLVEEEIVGIEYKFTKPIIYLNKPPEEKKAKVKGEAEMSLDAYKNDFKRRASQKNIPRDKMSFLWRNHVKIAIERRKDFFFREARKRNLSNVEALWEAYHQKLLSS
ncbi:hypothetical protein AYK26_00110 [Euryarchaeota archaeon SM23-78]|nr:MAG: hypothetical protein AYK26_00110 [Euryarchaeota archaeon SM23-78]MBW3000519.1 hypothetical protein [Candidatus Woesearchaeota archaeon]